MHAHNLFTRQDAGARSVRAPVIGGLGGDGPDKQGLRAPMTVYGDDDETEQEREHLLLGAWPRVWVPRQQRPRTR